MSPVELIRAYLERIERLDGRLRAYITVCRDAALEAARRRRGGRDARRAARGAPWRALAVKDQFDTAGVRTTCGSRHHGRPRPAEDATIVARLNAAGGILLGKLNLTEFALGGTQRVPVRPAAQSVEPRPRSRAAPRRARASRSRRALCAVSLGEDTGGSVRSPASFCGVVGLRPTWGRVSRHGSFPLCWSMDTPGPLSRTVEDAALVLQAIAGHDPRDPLTSRAPVPDYARALGRRRARPPRSASCAS